MIEASKRRAEEEVKNYLSLHGLKCSVLQTVRSALPHRESLLSQFIVEAWATARLKGWHREQLLDDRGNPMPANIGLKIALAHSELSEALEEVRGNAGLGIYFVDKGSLLDQFNMTVADVRALHGDELNELGRHVDLPRYEETDDHYQERLLKMMAEPFPKPCGFVVELADAVIRIFDMAVSLKLPLAEAITVKSAYNRVRPYRHGNKAA